jgi:hypothetical protein
MNKPKKIGTAAETAVTRFLVANGFPHAERRALRGELDAGDITGCPGICIEVKGGEAAKSASDALIDMWLTETETERYHAAADIGLLVIQRRGVGPANAGRWWAVMRVRHAVELAAVDAIHRHNVLPTVPFRMLLADAVLLLRAAGYGRPLEEVA